MNAEGDSFMEIQLAPDIQEKLEKMARDTGCSNTELLEDAVAGHFDEWSMARGTLNRRFDELESGQVKPIPLEEVRRLLKEKTEAQRRSTTPA
jgi:predicted transcriptional regulator